MISTKPSNRLLDIELLMAKIRKDVANRREGAPQTNVNTSVGPYVLGTKLSFSQNGNVHAFLGRGWSREEPLFKWAEAEKAEIYLEFESAPEEMILEFEVHPLSCEAIPSQRIQAEWNGIRFGEWNVRKKEHCRSLVYPHLIRDYSPTVLSFTFPDRFSPASQKINDDPRELSVAFHSLQLFPVANLGFSV